jgi:hypothetical protein
VPNPKNKNIHPDKQIKVLAKIIDARGQRSPIVISKRSGFITKGHGRLMAIKMLGWEKAAVDLQDYESEAEEYADMIADNEIARYAEFDKESFLEDLNIEDFDPQLYGLINFSIGETTESQEEPNGKSAMEKLEQYLSKEFMEVKLEYGRKEYDEFIALTSMVMHEMNNSIMSDALLGFLRKWKK